MFEKNHTIETADLELWQAMQLEDQRQEQHIELIASENYTSYAVMEAQGGKMTNKYAEGYAGKRYYGGCEYVDVAEELAIERLKSCTMPNTPTYSLTRGLKPIVRYF